MRIFLDFRSCLFFDLRNVRLRLGLFGGVLDEDDDEDAEEDLLGVDGGVLMVGTVVEGKAVEAVEAAVKGKVVEAVEAAVEGKAVEAVEEDEAAVEGRTVKAAEEDEAAGGSKGFDGISDLLIQDENELK